MITETLIEAEAWKAIDLPDLAERAALAVIAHLGLEGQVEAVSVLGCDDGRIAQLNLDFRDKPRATNVLSWPSEDLASDMPGGAPDLPRDPEIGNIAIALETCLREADDMRKPLSAHVTHLLVHGMLHLLGYDHIREEDAVRMERLESAILKEMGEPDPWG